MDIKKTVEDIDIKEVASVAGDIALAATTIVCKTLNTLFSSILDVANTVGKKSDK